MKFKMPDPSGMNLSTSLGQRKLNGGTKLPGSSAGLPCSYCTPDKIDSIKAYLAKYYPGASSELLTSLAVSMAMNKETPVYPSQMGTMLTSLAASINLTAINSEQKDCFIQPEMYVRLLDSAFFPRHYNSEPFILNFDEDGNLPGTPASAEAQFSLTIPDLTTIGYLFVVKRADLLNGVCQFGVKTSVYTGSFELTDNQKEGRLAVLAASALGDATQGFKNPVVTATGVTEIEGKSVINVDPNAFCLDVPSTFKYNVTGINANVKVYPLVMTRERFLQALRVIFSRHADRLVGTFLDYV